LPPRRAVHAHAHVVVTIRAQMSTTTVRVHYIRHGESQWNAEQQAARRRGVSESFVRTLAAEPRFTDSPLSETGVRQAISLRARLMEGSDGLAAALRCAADGSCAAPTLIVSNLRRAVDTGLLALRHLLDAREDLRVAVLPALQESCHYADCGPLPLAAGLRLEPPVISAAAAIEAARESAEAAMRHVVGTAEAHEEAEAEEALSRATRHSVVGTVLAAQARALAASGGADAAWLREDGYPRLHLDPRHAEPEVFDDRRRLSDALRLARVVELDDAALGEAVRPLLARLGAVGSELLSGGGAAGGGVIAGHSRLLRELLWAFSTGQDAARLSVPLALGGGSGGVVAGLRWDGGAADGACASLASEHTKLSNCGVVSFDLVLERPVGAKATLTLRGCSVDGVVTSRSLPAGQDTPGSDAPGGDALGHQPPRVWPWRGETAAAVSAVPLLLCGLVALCGVVAARRRQRRKAA